MKLGAVYPQIELGGDPAALHRIAEAVETLGYDHLVLYDHVVGAVHAGRTPPLTGPYTERDPFHDPFTAFAYIAAITRKIELVTGILILPQRQTVLVGKQATDVDLLSGGRLHLGVGTGWNYVEYEALGTDFAARGKRLGEQIALLRRLWSEPVVTFDGVYDHITRAGLVPRPGRRIPIYCGGSTEPAFKRAAQLADGFIFAGSIETALPGLGRLRELLRDNGREHDGFRTQLLLQTPRYGGLSADETLRVLDQWQDAGGSHASVVSMGLDHATAGQHLGHFERVKSAVDRR